jgi:hypothetical protein
MDKFSEFDEKPKKTNTLVEVSAQCLACGSNNCRVYGNPENPTSYDVQCEECDTEFSIRLPIPYYELVKNVREE